MPVTRDELWRASCGGRVCDDVCVRRGVERIIMGTVWQVVGTSWARIGVRDVNPESVGRILVGTREAGVWVKRDRDEEATRKTRQRETQMSNRDKDRETKCYTSPYTQ
ncbi:hypothetical protein Pmani_024356 [Petrolisthes manimaculis]|uniref:Uncharacterized protein n=1 Tax=Petrolisthes manimaculis TaxID=1843537 RepID=A0AAE1PAA4_9EUCA|nr:hypothetical protein Pmani_024356 [Petrolisthes manimaculis]